VSGYGSTAGPDGPRWLPRQGPGFDVPAERSPDAHLQPSALVTLDYGSGALVVTPPEAMSADLPQDTMSGGF